MIGVLDHCGHREKVNSYAMTCSPILVNHSVNESIE